MKLSKVILADLETKDAVKDVIVKIFVGAFIIFLPAIVLSVIKLVPKNDSSVKFDNCMEVFLNPYSEDSNLFISKAVDVTYTKDVEVKKKEIKDDGNADSKKEEINEEVYVPTNTGNLWWPIGSFALVKDKDNNTYAKDDPVWNLVSSDGYFGERTYSNGVTETHNGIDIIAPIEGRKSNYLNYGNDNKYYVISSMKGTVINVVDGCKSHSDSSWTDSDESCGETYGNWILIEHENGLYTVYAHLYKGTMNVKIGDKVEQGQILAKMGSSGRTSETHLHYEVRTSRYYQGFLNPLDYVSSSNARH